MSNDVSRRNFLKASLGAAAAASAINFASPFAAAFSGVGRDPLPIKKGVLVSMLPPKLSYLDRFKMARDVGFETIQCQSIESRRTAEEIKEASEKSGLPIDSVENMYHWKYPLSSDDPAVVERSLRGMRISLDNAKLWGAHCVLLVPAVVNAKTSYQEAWTRSQQQIRKLIPVAQDAKVVIALEEVWNKFLLSPLEFARYVDEFKSSWVKVWFDVGNVVLYGYPQDWIRTLGPRIADLHVKGFKHKGNCYEWVNLGDGDIDWPEVRKALAEIHYKGAAVTELKGGDKAYLKDVSDRVSKYVLGA